MHTPRPVNFRTLDLNLLRVFDRVMAESDVIVVCALLTPETRHLVNARAFSLMKPTAYYINVGRGPIRGRVEHVHSGAAALFESLEQLLACMQDALDARGRRRIPPHSRNRSKADPARLTTPRRDHEA